MFVMYLSDQMSLRIEYNEISFCAQQYCEGFEEKGTLNTNAAY